VKGVWALAVAALLAGCLDDADLPTVPSGTVAPSALITVANNATACTRVFPAIVVDRAHAQTFLPEGFVAADASAFFGQDQATDRGVLIVSGMRCQASEWSPAGYREAMAGIFVEPPIADPDRAEHEHFYEIARLFPEHEPQSRTLADLGWTRFGDEVVLAYMGSPSHAASMRVMDGDGAVFSVTVPTAPAPDEFSGTYHIRWWHETAVGLGFHEYSFAPDAFLGEGTCDAPSGSLVASIMQATSCRGVLVMTGPAFDVEGRFRFEHGATASG
jgi:hypothetical protein